jgi:predicted AlkP superfamily phosphohydrolase/phosphomutase/tetratricopeptide (TPR) repeat protein
VAPAAAVPAVMVEVDREEDRAADRALSGLTNPNFASPKHKAIQNLSRFCPMMAPRKVLLIGWDAADWKVIRPLVDAGKMPNVQRLVEQGATGQIATLHPPLSPMLWTSIATGKRPFKHGVLGFAEPTQDGRGIRPVTNLSREAKALWNILNQNELRSIVVGWWPSHPAEPINGVMVSDHFHRVVAPLEKGWPLRANSVHPTRLAGPVGSVRVHPDQLTPSIVEPFIPLAREIDQDQDKRLAGFLRTLAECMSIQAAACWLLDHEPWDFCAVYFDSIDHFSHGFMRYHPPRQAWVEPRDFELYQNVVSTAYQFHDEMLGVLINKACEDATVILLSDHGFHPDHLRPASIPDVPAGPAIEHRDFGVFAISGPGINQNKTLYGASVLDVAPTVLTLFGLPVGEDMDGKVLLQAFAKTPKITFVLSWEQVPGDDGLHPPHARQDPVAAHEALEQMIALGYIERPDENRETAVRKTVRELRLNLGEAYQDAGRHTDAYQILSELHAAEPDEQRFAVRLFVSAQALGIHDEMRRIVQLLDGCAPDVARIHPATIEYLRAQLWIAEGRYGEALDALEKVMEANLVRPGLLLETAELYGRLHRWREAQQVYERAVSIDPDNAPAHIGLCRIALRRGRFESAAHSALDALERVHHDPEAHFLLGCALEGKREYQHAAEAFHAAVSFNPHFPEAHARLAALLQTHLGDAKTARHHRRLAREMKRGRPRKIERRTEAAFAHGDHFTSSQPVTFTPAVNMPPLAESLIVVTGLPRSGTSMIMQMLAAGGMPVLTDGLRQADENNPRGYFEFEPMKNLLNNSRWLFEQKGKAVKIIAPLLPALPPGVPCYVILCDRDIDEVLDSQERMLRGNGSLAARTRERRQLLRDEYMRLLARGKSMLAGRPNTKIAVIEHRTAITDSQIVAEKINAFLGGRLDVAKMVAAIDPALYRARLSHSHALLRSMDR